MEESTNPKDAIGRTKPPLHLIPSVANLIESRVMALGAAKYGPYNWRHEKVAATVYMDAISRHLMRYLDGEDNDDESGVSHIGHIRGCTGILLDAMEGGNLVDDRPKKGKAAEVIKRLTKPLSQSPIEAKTRLLQAIASKGQNGLTVKDKVTKCLLDIGCPADVSLQIRNGTTYSESGDQLQDLVYESGRMRGMPNHGFDLFDEARDFLLTANNRGVISPADIDRADTSGNDNQRKYAKRDFFSLVLLAEFAEQGGRSWVALLDGWEHSVGARAEVTISMWLGLPLCKYSKHRVTSLSDEEVKHGLAMGLAA